ncbi:hypothetical protein CWATWH8502_1832 [Crocosphaera watsonii WH 8502]|uniref:Uncharacterized protein n=1 Tax=Crocosphaera watsonii WH 8502 TaxID=423474 RepID=T2IJD1_CROWT|nr:hypothetical protein CWATWH8502_1832 [Crocosphaera watsonii WH 8502]
MRGAKDNTFPRLNQNPLFRFLEGTGNRQQATVGVYYGLFFRKATGNGEQATVRVSYV